MDLRAYYKKVRDVESNIVTPFVVVIGLETPDGGRAGTEAEVAKPVAAKLVAEGRCRLASDEEARAFYAAQANARNEADALAAAQRMQVTIVPSHEYRGKQSKSSKE